MLSIQVARLGVVSQVHSYRDSRDFPGRMIYAVVLRQKLSIGRTHADAALGFGCNHLAEGLKTYMNFLDPPLLKPNGKEL